MARPAKLVLEKLCSSYQKKIHFKNFRKIKPLKKRPKKIANNTGFELYELKGN